jgi:iron complex outermembrane receptor protein
VEKQQPPNAMRLAVFEAARRRATRDAHNQWGEVMSKRALWLASATALIATPAISSAQESQTADVIGIEEVVVTARKREENLQDVPLSITAFSADAIEERGLRGLADIAAQTPGFSFENYGGGLSTPVIRGQTQGVLTNPVQNVASFFNGVYLQKNYMIDASLLAIQQVEVLKGPQSALYGRNAFSGAINYRTRRPTDKYEGDVSLTVGTDERYEATGWVSLPLTEKFGLLLSAGHKENDGTWDNDHPLADDPQARTKGNLGGLDQNLAYVAAQFRPTDRLTFDLQYSRADSTKESAPLITRTTPGLTSGVNAAGFALNNMNCSLPPARPAGVIDPRTGLPVSTQPAATTPVLYCGEVNATIELAPGEVRNGELIVDPRALGYDGTTNIFALNTELSLTESWDLVYTFGKVTGNALIIGAPGRNSTTGVPIIPGLTAPIPGVVPNPAFGYLRNGTLALFDPAANAVSTTFDSRPNGNVWARTHELRAQYNDEGLIGSAIFGLYQAESEDREQGRSLWSPINTFDRLRSLSVSAAVLIPAGFTNTILDNNVRSAFGSIEFNLGEAIDLTLEGRYTNEKVRLYDLLATGGAGLRLPPVTFKHFEPRVSVDWKISDDVLLYLSAAEGFKNGGYNGVTPDPVQTTYEPEENRTFELGAKTSWLDNRLTANIALYFTDWTDLQQNEARRPAPGTPGAIVSALVIGNIGDATSRGVEIDGSWAITDALRLDYGVSFADSEFDDGTRSDRYFLNSMCDGTICALNGDVSGNQLQRAPKTKANLGLSYEFGVGADWRIGSRLDASYQSKQFLDEVNIAWLEPRTLLNASVSASRGPFEARLWARNLTDEEYLSSSLVLVGTAGARSTSLTSFYGEQREVGLTVSYKFGE